MDVMTKQESVFTKEHMDRLLAEDRRVDATGKLGQCSLTVLLEESGALDDQGSHYGPLAQAAASYYVRQRMDDINAYAYELKTEKGSAGFYPGTALGRLANEMATVNLGLQSRGGKYTSIVDKGTEELMWATGHLDNYEDGFVGSFTGKAVHFPADTRRFSGQGLGYPTRTMDTVMKEVKQGNLTYEFYGHNQKQYMQDRFCELLADIEKQQSDSVGKWHAKSVMFEEVYKSQAIALEMSHGKQGFIPPGRQLREDPSRQFSGGTAWEARLLRLREDPQQGAGERAAGKARDKEQARLHEGRGKSGAQAYGVRRVRFLGGRHLLWDIPSIQGCRKA